jgi:hypothetical protein
MIATIAVFLVGACLQAMGRPLTVTRSNRLQAGSYSRAI